MSEVMGGVSGWSVSGVLTLDRLYNQLSLRPLC